MPGTRQARSDNGTTCSPRFFDRWPLIVHVAVRLPPAIAGLSRQGVERRDQTESQLPPRIPNNGEFIVGEPAVPLNCFRITGFSPSHLFCEQRSKLAAHGLYDQP